MIDKSKTYRTRNGREVRIYATDGCGPYPVHGAVKETKGWDFYIWTEDGVGSIGTTSSIDLIEVRPRIKRTVWLNVYRSFVWAYTSEEAANDGASNDRLSCVQVEIDCEEGEGL